MRRDQQLVERLLDHIHSSGGPHYGVVARPEELDRRTKAVEVIASSPAGRTLAVEHTLAQPFVGKKADDAPFLAVMAPLEKDQTLRLAGFGVDLKIDVGAISKGVDWSDVSTAVADWYRSVMHTLPEGISTHNVPGLPFTLAVHVVKDSLPGLPGKLFVWRPLRLELGAVIRTALSTKLPKLVAAAADERILLFEQEDPLWGYPAFTSILESLASEFPALRNIDAVWVVKTVVWETEGVLWFCQVWPSLSPARRAQMKGNDLRGS